MEKVYCSSVEPGWRQILPTTARDRLEDVTLLYTYTGVESFPKGDERMRIQSAGAVSQELWTPESRFSIFLRVLINC